MELDGFTPLSSAKGIMKTMKKIMFKNITVKASHSKYVEKRDFRLCRLSLLHLNVL